jgi:hypothetical protein
MNLLKYK